MSAPSRRTVCGLAEASETVAASSVFICRRRRLVHARTPLLVAGAGVATDHVGRQRVALSGANGACHSSTTHSSVARSRLPDVQRQVLPCYSPGRMPSRASIPLRVPGPAAPPSAVRPGSSGHAGPPLRSVYAKGSAARRVESSRRCDRVRAARRPLFAAPHVRRRQWAAAVPPGSCRIACHGGVFALVRASVRRPGG